MTKVKRNSHKARDRKNKIKARVKAYRERNGLLKLAYHNRNTKDHVLTEVEKIENQQNAESFIKAVGEENNWPLEVIDETIVRLRFDWLNGTKTHLTPSFECSL